MKEADIGGAIAITNKDNYIAGSSTLLEVGSTYHKMTNDMMETCHTEAENLLSSNSIAIKHHISKLLPSQP